ncbi:hypothetical protein PBAL39_17594 [Pedobacter sp. BAL39]|uniref:LiaF transmembrane domain-containing protein n=1 Tax=Pedobacter sp. BAL39 TaxID=391596 RepID=UPI000155AB65|nr:DUF5668 domain-containing protein [Pedobacter sp. BAL39]EDM33900.1 hypothetical protein PBAL39_17594 [Pedobacter sp. BAL39]
METFKQQNKVGKYSGFGLLLVAVGIVFLLRNLGVDVPHWLFSWSSLMLVAGLWIGYKKNFRIDNWVLLVMIGGIFTIRDIAFFELSRITGALILIGLGIYLVIKPSKVLSFSEGCKHRKTLE